MEAMQQRNLCLVSLNHAIPAALPEISEMLKLLFGLNKRCESTFSVPLVVR